jgi:hypothetical protein
MPICMHQRRLSSQVPYHIKLSYAFVGDEKLTVNFPKRTISFPMYFHCPYLSGSVKLEKKSITNIALEFLGHHGYERKL